MANDGGDCSLTSGSVYGSEMKTADSSTPLGGHSVGERDE